jgi:tetratricopeptide (TPR) repeat protein
METRDDNDEANRLQQMLERARQFYDLGIGLRDRYQETKDENDLNSLIENFRKAKMIMLPESANLLGDLPADCFHELGTGLRERFRVHRQPNDLDEAIKSLQSALLTASENCPKRATRFYDYGVLLEIRFTEQRMLSDSDVAILYLQKSLKLTPEDHRDRLLRLQYLGISLRQRYVTTAKVQDIQQAINCFQEVIRCTLASDPKFPRRLLRLGDAFSCRYRHLQQLEDLNNAIELFQKARKALSKDSGDQVQYTLWLAVSLRERHRRIQNTARVDHIEYMELITQKFPANAAISGDDVHPSSHLKSLQINPRDDDPSKRPDGDPDSLDDLDLAINYLEKTLKLAPKNHQLRLKAVAELAAGLEDRFQRSKCLCDIKDAIEYLEDALNDISKSHPNQADSLLQLGMSFHYRYRKTGDRDDLRASYEACTLAFQNPLASQLIRLRAGRLAVQHLIEEENWGESSHIMEQILHFLPAFSPPTGPRNDLQHGLQLFNGIASLSASLLLKTGSSPCWALKALDSDRGAIVNLMIDARAEFSTLREKHPESWGKYKACWKQIASLNMEDNLSLPEDTPQTDITRGNLRQELSQKLSDIIEEIKAYPGFERFLSPPTAHEIRNIARSVPIVCYNISIVSSEAFLITADKIKVLPLPNFKQKDMRRSVQIAGSQGNSARCDASLCDDIEELPLYTSDMSTEMLSLWKNAVRPVLDELGLLGPKDASGLLPRIWWVGGGLMSLVPIHAAGEHTPGSTENTISHVVSSYAPTLKALQFVLSKASVPITDTTQKILIVSMPSTPGHQQLNVEEEILAIEKQSSSWATIDKLELPDLKSVLDSLKSCTIAHFACHGSADKVEPAKSALLVGKGSVERLTVGDMDAINPENAQIAYLSACSTADMKVQNLADESIHLCSSFQLAGFKHVIGTLWRADDAAAVEIASKFYQELNSSTGEGEGLVARALHKAVMQYRSKNGGKMAITKWATFIHLGP